MSTVQTASPEVPIASACGSFSCLWCSGDGARVGTLAGDLDGYAAPLLEESLRDAESDSQLIVLDLRRLDFMDLRGMRVLLQSSERLRRAGHRLVLVRGSRQVESVFTFTGADDPVEFVDPIVQVLLQLASDCA